jgi:hypothetical protein
MRSGKSGVAVEGEEVLLDHPAHNARGVRRLGVLAFEAVAIEQGEEELEVLLLARVRRGRHEEQVAGDVAEELTEEEALGLFELAAEVVSAHAVGFVDDDQVPLGVFELGPARTRCGRAGPCAR